MPSEDRGESTVDAGAVASTVGSGDAFANTAAADIGVDATQAPIASDATMPAPAGAASEALQVVRPSLYAERKVLSSGGMGRIVTAHDTRLKRRVAIKELHAQIPALRSRFEREVLLTAKLQHPNIVSIHEAGCWPSGEPFYAMELVPGRSLDKLFAETKTTEDRIALLPHVIAVADALAYAHKERIIHRDLKPQNVMVGEFGETVVIDWGLGKDLDSSEADPGSQDVRASDGGGDQTRIGDVLGTPAYMPPEQAAGEPASETADVYAIGAILYHLLSGRPPYGGKDSKAVLDAVLEGPPVPLEQRQAGLPPDLLAIVRRALSREPASRYPTARELADDLRRFQTGQLVGAHQYTTSQLVRRWVRKHKTTVSIAAILASALVVTAGVAFVRIRNERDEANRQRGIATQQRRDSETGRQAAEKLVEFMVFTLRDRLQPVGKLELMEGIGDEVVGYYDSVASIAGTQKPETSVRRATALSVLGDVELQKGNLQSARRAHKAAFDLVESARAAEPNESKWSRDLSVAHNKLGDIAQKLEGAEPDAALRHYEASLALVEGIVAKEPTNDEWQGDLAMTQNKIGDTHYMRGELDLAFAAYDAARVVREAQSKKAPDAVSSLTGLSHVYSRIGNVQAARGKYAESLAAHRSGLEALERVATMKPDDVIVRRNLMMSTIGFGDLQVEMGAVDDGLASYRRALDIARALVATDPVNETWQRDEEACHLRIVDALIRKRALSEAIASVDVAHTIAARLAAKDPANTEWQRDLSIALDVRGDVLAKLGKFDEAARAQEKSVGIARRLAAADPTNGTLQTDISGSLVKLGQTEMAAGRNDQALTRFRESVAILQTQLAAHPDSSDLMRQLGVAHERIGNALRALGKLDAAGAAYQEGVDVSQRRANLAPDNIAEQVALGIAFTNVGDVYKQKGEHPAAAKAYSEALAIFEKLDKKASSPETQFYLIQAIALGAESFAATGEPRTAALIERARTLAPELQGKGILDEKTAGEVKDALAAAEKRLARGR